jgi:large conductance mechanosensitive channel
LSTSIPSITGKKASILTYGSFIQSVVNFLIISFSVFIMVKFINKLKRLKSTPEEEIVEEKLSKEQQLLTEIRDLLKEK